jgi:hypothetical protein
MTALWVPGQRKYEERDEVYERRVCPMGADRKYWRSLNGWMYTSHGDVDTPWIGHDMPEVQPWGSIITVPQVKYFMNGTPR